MKKVVIRLLIVLIVLCGIIFFVVGNKVRITYNGIIMESYPAQIIATKIELVK